MWAPKITKLLDTSDYDLYYISRDINNQKTDGRESGVGRCCVSTFQWEGKARQILRDVVLTSTFTPTGSDSCVNQSIMTQACVWNPSGAQKCFSHTTCREISTLHLLLSHAVGPQLQRFFINWELWEPRVTWVFFQPTAQQPVYDHK